MTESAVTQQPASAGGVGASFLKLGTGEAAARVVAFVATVYLARTLGAASYGVIVLATTVMLYFTVLTDCGVEALGVRDVAADPAALPTLVPAILGARLLVAVALVCVAVTAGLALLPQPEGAIVAAYAFSMLVVALGTRWAHLGLQQAGYASSARVMSEVLSALLIIALVRGPDDLGRIPVTQLVGESAGAFLLLHLLPRGVATVRVSLKPEMVTTLFRESWPLVLHALLGLAIFNSDFIALRVFRDSATVGLYAAAYTLISFFLNLGAVYTLSMLPVITRLREQPVEAKALYDASMAQVLAGAVPVAVGGYLVADAVIRLVFGGDYAAASLPLQILIWSIPVAVIRNVAQGVLIAYGRTNQLLRAAAWAAGLNIVLNILLIPGWGMAGAAVATLITECARSAMVVTASRRAGVAMASVWRFRRVLGAGAIMALAVATLGDRHLALLVAAGGISYVAALVALGGVRFRRGAFPELAP